jgi:hypothetical protein
VEQWNSGTVEQWNRWNRWKDENPSLGSKMPWEIFSGVTIFNDVI